MRTHETSRNRESDYQRYTKRIYSKGEQVTSFRNWNQLNDEEKEKLDLIFISLQEFSYGFVRADQISEEVQAGAASLRCYMNTLYQYCASYFLTSGHDKLGDVLISFGSGDLLEPINEIFNKQLGKTTFGEIIRAYRNKVLAHPSYMFAPLEKRVHEKYDIMHPDNALENSGIVIDLYYQTQVLFKNLLERYPEAV